MALCVVNCQLTLVLQLYILFLCYGLMDEFCVPLSVNINVTIVRIVCVVA